MPITPGATGASFDVLLAFSLDEEANRRVQSRVSTMEEELKRLQDEAKGVGSEFKESGEEVKKTSKDVSKQLRAEARLMRSEVDAMIDDIKEKNISLLRELSSTIANVSQKALITGGAIIGGIFAEAQRYVNLAPDATRETRLWVAETERLGKARNRIDAVLVREALPLLTRAARLANQAAGIVERHPEIVSLALKAGGILVGVGAIGLAVSKGIKLVADAMYLSTIPVQLTAAKLQDLAGDKQLAAAKLRLKDLGGTVPGGGAVKAAGGLSAVPVIGGTLLAAAGSFGLAKSLNSIGDQLREKIGVFGDLLVNGLAAPLSRFVPLLGPMRLLENNIPGIKKFLTGIFDVGEAAEEAGDSMDRAAGKIRGSANEAAIVEAFSSWKEDDARLIKEAAENRKRILAEAEREIANITRQYASERVSINKRFNEARANITSEFEKANKEAEESYQASRASLISEGTQRIQEIEESHQERLREIRKSAAERIEELSADRDALGLVKEQRRLADAEAEENRSLRIEKERARRETEQRLAELDSQYSQERERRRLQFEQDLKQNELERAEELKQAAAAYQAEITQAREAQNQKLRELQEGLNAERLRRREVFIAQIRDLDAALLGEQALRQRKYNDMLRDAEAFLIQYQKTLPSGGSPFSGVTGSTGFSTNQDSMIKTVAAAVAGSTLGILSSRGDVVSANYYDNRRMDAPLSKDARDIYEKTATRALSKALGVA